MKPVHASFTKLIECYFDTWSLFAQILLTGPVLLYKQDGTTGQREIPRHLQAAYRLLHLQTEVSLVEARRQYRELAKLYHPDTGGITPTSSLYSRPTRMWWSTYKRFDEREEVNAPWDMMHLRSVIGYV